jgi:hypothetical protein
MQFKIIVIVFCLLITISSFPLTANFTSFEQQTELEGRILFTARSMGPCLIGFGYGITGNYTSDAYIEPGKGLIINFGIMPYYNLNSSFFANWLVEDNNVTVLWKLREKTLLSIGWRHEEVKYHLKVICTPLEETTGLFLSNESLSIIGVLPTFDPLDHQSNCMTYTGNYRNGSKTEDISGLAVLLSVGKKNASSIFPEPIIMIWLLEKNDEGEIEPLLMSIWSKNGWSFNEITIEKATTFHVNFWILQRLFSL